MGEVTETVVGPCYRTRSRCGAAAAARGTINVAALTSTFRAAIFIPLRLHTRVIQGQQECHWSGSKKRPRRFNH